MNRLPVTQEDKVTSSHALLTFTVSKLKRKGGLGEVDILSMLDDTLIISDSGSSHLHLYTREGLYLSSISVCNNDLVYDAMATPRGNIIYTTKRYKKVVVVSVSGEIIANNKMADPKRISVSEDNSIYLADFEVGTYQSTDDGFTWTLVMKLEAGWQCWQAIKVATHNDVSFWMRGRKNGTRQVRKYSTDKVIDTNFAWRASLLIEESKHINTTFGCLLFDGRSNVFLSDANNKAVHIFSPNGSYRYQLLSTGYLKFSPRKLLLDKENQLFVGQSGNVVESFKLTYEVRKGE